MLSNFRRWVTEILITIHRLKWVLLLGFGAIYAIDLGWLTGYSKLQLIAYKLAVCSVAVAFSQLVWIAVYPYASVQEALKTHYSDKILGICILRGLVFLAIVLAITLGL